MPILIQILLATFLAGFVSLSLVGLLLLFRSLIKLISFRLVAFAAGALLATGFLDTMKESVEMIGDRAFLYVLLSIAGFFLIERMFLHLHHHDEDEEHQEDLRLPVGLLIFGDALHNFIDGASIAASFLVGVPVGIITTIAVFVHEIPHELGDFGILLHKGWGRKKVFLFNALTGLAGLAGAVITYSISSQVEALVPILLAVTSGNFIYLSATDLLPEIHHHSKKHPAVTNVIFFLLGIAIMVILTTILHE